MAEPVLILEVRVDPPTVEVQANAVAVEVDPAVPAVAPVAAEPVVVFAATEGKPGPPGPGSPFLVITQADFDALPVKDPGTLYVVT